MALFTALRRATTTISSSSTPASTASKMLFTRLFNNNYSNNYSTTRRLFSSSIPIVDSGEDNCTINYYGGSFTRSDQFPIQRGMCNDNMENPFQISGPKGAFEAKKVEEGLYVRMEMPGIEKEDVKVWVEYGNVYVKGEGKKESEHEDNGRVYDASLEIFSNLFQPDQINAELKNGVLRMIIPKSNNYHDMITRLHHIKVK